MSPDARVWLLMAAAGLGTFAIRYSFIGLATGAKLPPWAARLL